MLRNDGMVYWLLLKLVNVLTEIKAYVAVYYWGTYGL